jgi:DNA-binding NarL/FixJ family response regulator
MRALIIEDHELFADALGAVLHRIMPSVAVETASSAEAAVEKLTSGAPVDLILLDLGLPGRKGRAAFDVVQAAAGRAAIALVSASEPTAEVAALIRQGARGFIHKRSTTAELTTALRFILDGGTHVPPSLLHLPSASDDIVLTPRQTEVLRLLAKGLSNKEIAQELGCAEPTVRVHVSTVMRLLDVENRTQAAMSALARRLAGDE